MNRNDFVILPGSKPGTSVRLKAKTGRELELEKMQLETENAEMEKKLRQLQSNMRREKEERRKSSGYHWRSGQTGPITIQARSEAKNNKVSSGKVKLQMLKEQTQEPMKEPFKHEMANAVAPEKSEMKGIAHGLCEIKSALLAEAGMSVGKLEAIDRFIKEVNLDGLKINREQKQVYNEHQVSSDKFSSLPASVGSGEDLSSESTCTGLENQDKGLLLNGTFNEEESAKSFQEALLRWRKGNCERRKQPCASEVLSESAAICEVQTNFTVTEESVQIEFKKDGLSYMEKLLLKKYRRTPVDQISGSCVKDLRPVQTLSVHEAVIGGEGEGGDDDDDVSDLTVEDVRKYWTSIFRKEVPKTVSESAEPSLKIEFLDDLQDVATRQQSVSAQYWGLEGFFAVGTNPKQVMPEARSSLCAGSSPVDSTIPFPGSGKWVSETSLSEYADDSLIQGVLEGNDSRRLWSTNMLHCNLPGSCPTNTQPRSKSVFGADAELSEHECLDVTKQEKEDLWECVAAQEALLTLERELQSYTGPEKYCSLTCEGVTSSSRHSEKICRNATDFPKNLDLKDLSRVDPLRGWDESWLDDEEETLEDKQQVLALQ